MNRRTLLSAGAAALCLPYRHALADASAFREFRILRDGSDIGRHSLAARVSEGRFEIVIEIDIVVRVLGIAAYRYELRNREIWAGGRLQSLESQTNDDGDKVAAKIELVDGQLEIDGTGHSGTAPAEAVTTSYFVTDFLERRPWLSSQTGKPLEITVAGGPRRAVIGGELPTTLIYDARGEWMGSIFDAGGEDARYELVSENGAIAPLWRTA